ncbi:MAG: hypothetical protein HGA35_07765 [Erysipelotrichaceae bacterium]|nr:hypothetical protein [Erysipelotrichaceae bacterium]
MFGILKKLFTSKKETAPVISNNQELIEKLYNLIYDDNLVLRINKPESKILLLNVYYLTFGDLLLNIVSKTSERQIASVNFFSYFRDIDDLKYTLKRIIPILESTTVNVKIVHDLNEIIDSLDFLKSIEE